MAERKAESSLALEQPVWGGLLKTLRFPHYFCFPLPPRCPIPEGTTPQSEAAGAVTTNTIGAESIRDEEAAPGRAAVTGRGGGGGKTATTSAPGGEAACPRSRARSCSRWRTESGICAVVCGALLQRKGTVGGCGSTPQVWLPRVRVVPGNLPGECAMEAGLNTAGKAYPVKETQCERRGWSRPMSWVRAVRVAWQHAQWEAWLRDTWEHSWMSVRKGLSVPLDHRGRRRPRREQLCRYLRGTDVCLTAIFPAVLFVLTEGGPCHVVWQGTWPEQKHLMGVCCPTAATMTVHRTGERTTGDTVAATGAMTTAGSGQMPTTTLIVGTPTTVTGRPAATVARAAAAGSTGGGGGTVGPSAARPR